MLIKVFCLLLVWSVCDDYIINTHFLKENSYAFPNKLIQSFPKLKVLACVTPHWFLSDTHLEGGEEEREAGGQTTLPLSPPLSGFVQENPTQSLPLCCVVGLEQGNERQTSLFPSNKVSFLYDSVFAFAVPSVWGVCPQISPELPLFHLSGFFSRGLHPQLLAATPSLKRNPV